MTSLKKISVLFLLLLFIFSARINSQQKIYNLTMRNGLTTNIVNYAHKDAKGFIWFATDDGIYRYDGVRLTNFNSEKSRTIGLEENIFFQIYQHTPDTLLFLSYSGQLYIYDYKRGRFSNLSKSNPLLSKVALTSLIKSRNDNSYWFSTDRGIINTTSIFTVIKEYQIPDRDKDQTVSNRVISIYMDEDSVLWLGMLSRGILMFDTKRKKFVKDKVSGIVPKYQQVNAFYSPKSSDYIFAATGGEGLVRINKKNFSYVKWRYKANSENSLPSDRITTLLSQNDSILWVGTIDGLAKFNLRKNVIERFVNNPLDQYSLCNNSIHHIYIDNQNILWISTAGGISRLNTKPIRFKKISRDALQRNSLSSNRISQCFPDKSGNLWVASANGINLKANGEDYFHHYLLPKSFETHKNEEVIKIFVDGNTWWIGTWGGGISRVAMPNNFKPGDQLQFTNFYNEVNDKNSISSNFIRDFCTDENGNLWISTWNGGLNKIKVEDKLKNKISFQRFINHGNSAKSVASDFIDAIVSDSSGMLWLCTSEGLQYYDYRKNTFSMVYSDSSKGANKTITPSGITFDKDKNIWYSHFTGISRVKKAGNGSYLNDFVINNRKYAAYAMTKDKDGIFWFSTFKSGLCSYNPKDNQIKLYSMIEEVDGFDFYFGEATTDENNNLYFGGNSGYLTFNSRSLYANGLTPPVLITSIKIEGEEINLNTDISNVKELSLNYDQRNISISFAALNYIHSDRNEYKYLLEGQDKKWVELGNKNEITFANLPAGNYNLKIIGANNDGVWNYKAAVLSIKVNPPFWANNYYRALFVLFILSVITSIIIKKIRKLKAEKEIQFQFSKLMIEAQEEERKRVSQELHDSLGQNLLVIKNQLDIYSDSGMNDRNELGSISELVKESISEVKEISSNLHPHQLERLGLSKAIKAMLSKASQASSISIESNIQDMSGLFTRDQEINIYRIIQESLNNILKHSNAQIARVELHKNGAHVVIMIVDDGVGFDTATKEMENKFRDGLGLKSIKERVRLLKGILSIESSIGKGTKITVTINSEK